jgi:activating signal cointegrator 1
MKVLTLTQPWATLVAIGAKKIETRSWSTSYRGPLAIHAAKGLGSIGGYAGLRRLWATEPFRTALWDYETPNALPLGSIVAVCDLVAVGRVDRYEDEEWSGSVLNFGWRMDNLPEEPEFSFGDYSPGRFVWLLANVRALPVPIPCKGALGLWNYEGELPI